MGLKNFLKKMNTVQKVLLLLIIVDCILISNLTRSYFDSYDTMASTEAVLLSLVPFFAFAMYLFKD